MLLLLLVAFGLRVFRLDAQSFWSDEGASAVMASRTIAAILLNTAADIHPPLYYLLLRLWSQAAGTSEFGLRFLSVGSGMLAVAALVPLARRLSAGPVAIPALAVGAIAPFWVYYSQEARMYAPVLALSALAAYCGIRLAQEHRPRVLWIGYAGLMLAALYTQYFALTVFLFVNVAFVLWNPAPWHYPGRWVRWAIAQAVVLAGFAPWLPTMSAQGSTWPAISERLQPLDFFVDVLRIFAWGLSWDWTATARSLAFVAALLAASAYWLWWAEPRDGGPGREKLRYATLALYLVTPVLVMLAISLQRPAYNPKLLLVATPAFCIALGAGVAGIGSAAARLLTTFRTTKRLGVRVAMPAVVVLLLAITAYFDARSLYAYYFIPKYGRDDYRGLAGAIESQARDGDAIVLTAPGQIEIFDYYYHGKAPRHPLPKQRPIDPRDTELRLQKLTEEHRRFWMVRWASEQADPNGVIDGWLARLTFRTYDRWFGNVQLILYQVARFEPAEAANPVKVTFGDRVELQGYSVPQIKGSGAGFEPGEVIPLTLVWQGLRPMTQRYTVFTHLVDRNEVHIWGQRDNEPVSGLKPTTAWAPGGTIVDNYGIQILPGTPPGEYEIEVGLYESATGYRLSAQTPTGPAGDRFVIGPIIVQRSSLPEWSAPEEAERRDVEFDDLRVLGFEFRRLGALPGDRTLRPGQIAHLTVYWRAEEQPTRDLDFVLRVAADGDLIQEIRRPPAHGTFPTSEWRAGELVREQFKIPVDRPGRYRLLLGVRDRDAAVVPSGAGAGPDGLVQIVTFEVRP